MDWTTARTVYNVADARWPGADAVGLLRRVERELRHAGPGAARRFWLACRLIDWGPLVHGPVRRRFWRLPRAERMAAVERASRSRLRLLREGCQRIERGAGLQSSPGA